MSRALDLLDAAAARFSRQAEWRNLWQEIALLIHPGRASFGTQQQNTDVNPEVYDGTPSQTRRGLGTTIDGLLKPSTTRWFWMKAENAKLNDDDEVKRWFDLVQDRMWDAIYSPEAGFISQSGAVDNDLASFGWGVLQTMERRNRSGLTFRSLFIGDVAIGESGAGRVDTADIRRTYTARQAAQIWSDDKLSPKIKEALASTNRKDRDKEFEFIECVYPRSDRDPRKSDNLNLPFASCIICKNDETIIEETGFNEFPMAIPRWEILAGQVYPRGPGWYALADSRTLQAVGKTLLIAGQWRTDPPKWVIDDGVLSPVRTWPGGLTVVSAEAVKETGGRPMGVLDAGGELPIGREMQQDYRQMVEAAFFKNLFNLPEDKTQRTAYEYSLRKEEFIRQIGPTFGQLEQDYIGVIVPRVFGIMSRAGQFPEAPEALQGQGARFEFMSPIQQAKKMIEAGHLNEAFQFAAPIIQAQPETLDNIAGDEIIRDLPDAFGLPQKWLKSKQDVAATRQERQQHQMAAAAMDEVEQASGIAKNIGGAMPQGAPAQ